MSDIRSVIDWLSDGARSAQLSEDVLTDLCRRMIEAGIPLWRAAVFVTTLHPDFMGRAFYWRAESGVKVSEAEYKVRETDEYLQKPGRCGLRHAASRCGAGSPTPIVTIDFAVLEEFRAEGATD